MPNTQPHQFPRRILFALTGLNPQIVTETLYALLLQKSPAFIPTEIRLLTTQTGAERARIALLEQKKIQQLLDEYGFKEKIDFTEAHIECMRDAAGKPLEDVRTESDNLAAAEAIKQAIQTYSNDPDSAIHASLTGGRNTGSYYLGLALSLYGRPQDRLSHVLINSALEASPAFFYPPKATQWIISNRNDLIHTSETAITLSEIPFLRLRSKMDAAHLQHNLPVNQIVETLQEDINNHLRIHLTTGEIHLGSYRLQMAPILKAFYTWLAELATDSQASYRITTPHKADTQRFLKIYAQFAGLHSDDFETAAANLCNGMDKEFFVEKRSRINRAIRDLLPNKQGEQFIIHSTGNRPHTHYGLIALKPDQIDITE